MPKLYYKSGSSWVNALNIFYPIGAIYQSTSATSPASIIGGTWSAIQNRFLVGAGGSYAVNSTGGEASHKLTVNEMPSHTHPQNVSANSGGSALRCDYVSDIRGQSYPQGIDTNATGGGHHTIICRPITEFISGDARLNSFAVGGVA